MSILQVVAVASRSGAYGGPFDTAKRQVVMAQESGLIIRLWAGSLSNDEPDVSSLPEGTVLVPVQKWLPAFGFASVISLGALRSLFREIRRSDTIHVSFSRELLPVLASIIAVLLRKRLVLQPHGMLTSRTSILHRIVDVVVKPLVRASAAVVALTEVERAQLSKWLGSDARIKWLVMGNPVGRLEGGPPTIVRTRPAAREALWVARIHPRKRVQDFLDAAAISQNHARGVTFTVVGPDGGELSAVQRACGSVENLSYEGTLTADDVTKRVNGTGVFVLTSLKEPWGNVLATALSLGVPVVLTESSALAATVSYYGAGLIVPDKAPMQLDTAISELLDNQSLYESCSSGALQLAASLFSESVQTAQLAILYGQTAS